jgi:hypothetical protein
VRYTSNRAENLIDNDVIGSDPSDEGKVAKGGEDVVGDPSPNEHAQETVHEIAVPCDGPSFNLIRTVIPVEGVEKRAVNQRRGPHHSSRPDEETAHDASERISNTLR